MMSTAPLKYDATSIEDCPESPRLDEMFKKSISKNMITARDDSSSRDFASSSLIPSAEKSLSTSKKPKKKKATTKTPVPGTSSDRIVESGKSSSRGVSSNLLSKIRHNPRGPSKQLAHSKSSAFHVSTLLQHPSRMQKSNNIDDSNTLNTSDPNIVVVHKKAKKTNTSSKHISKIL